MNPDNIDKYLRSYQIKLIGSIDREFIDAYLPAECRIVQSGEITTLEDICTDQSGILGLVRHLHNLGCTIISIQSE